VLQSIDQDLKRGCEDVIAQCTDPICEPLRLWVHRAREQIGIRQETPPSAPGRQLPEDLDRTFRLACNQDLTASVGKLKLYLEDERTVSVVVTHIQDKIVEEYDAFRDVIRNMQADSLRDVALSRTALKGILKNICEGQADT
jgi:conserved oligomeric Golgi complex subunit 3